MELERIERLGAQGDGVAQGPDGPLFVPFTLPGELVAVATEPGASRAEPLAILEPSGERVEPVCPHFGTCGGCALQHMEARAYLAWKREQVVAGLASRGLEAPVEEVRSVPLGSRRCAAFALGRTARGVTFGYRAARFHATVDIAACPVLSPGIAGRLPKLKAALAPLLGGKREARVTVTEIGQGHDVAVEGVHASPQVLSRLAGESETLGLVRLTVDGDTAALLAEPTVNLSGAEVRPPAGSLSTSLTGRGAYAGCAHQGRRWVGKARGRPVCRDRHLHRRACSQRRSGCVRGGRGRRHGAGPSCEDHAEAQASARTPATYSACR